MNASRRIISLVAVILCLMTITASAQDSECGTVVTAEQILQEQAYHDVVYQAAQERDDYIIDIPIAVHILRLGDGTGGLDPADLQGIFDSTNIILAPGNLHFFQYGDIDYIDDDYYYYNLANSSDYDAVRNTNLVMEAVNVYFVPGSDISGFGYCGISAFTSSGVRGILVSNSCVDVTTNKSTFAHEVGHYFDLYHTHETAFGTECPDGSNCTYTGDLLCDTPADPNFYDDGIYYVSEYPECEYDHSHSIPGGCGLVPYDPDPSNLMSYSRKLCRDNFTLEQYAKFRSVAENIRTELSLGINGIYTVPRQVQDSYALLGNSMEDSVQIVNIGENTLEFTGAATSLGIITVANPVGMILNPGQSIYIKYSLDAAYTSDPCDLSPVADTLIFYTSDAVVAEIEIPAEISIVYNLPSAPQSQFGPSCLKFVVPNTPGFGDGGDTAFMKYNWNGLYDGSLMIGTYEDGEVNTYMDCYSQKDYSVIDGYQSAVDDYGRQIRRINFATRGDKIFGEVIYTYGQSDPPIDSCGYLLIEYVLKNPCDTTLLIYPGAYFDFDLVWSDWNNGVVDDTTGMILISTDDNVNLAVAVAPLYTCNGPAHLRVTRNDELIWPYTYFPDDLAYSELTKITNSSDYDHRDVGALVNFGPTVLENGDIMSFKVAVMFSSSGPNYLYTLLDDIKSLETVSIYDPDNDCVLNPLDNCPDTYNPGQEDSDGDLIGNACDVYCGDANSDGTVNVSDAVYIINYVFSGGNPPDPLENGNVNCDAGVNVSDAVYIINFVFASGRYPCDIDGDSIPDC